MNKMMKQVIPIPPISLGDLVRALETLHPADDQTAQAIAGLLGLELERPTEDQEETFSSSSATSTTALAPSEVASTLKTPAIQDHPPSSHEQTTETLEWLPSTISWSDEPARVPVLSVPPLPPQIVSEEVWTRPRFMPLFIPGWTRAILSDSMATLAEDGPVDIERLVEPLARGEAVRRMPRYRRPTLRYGVQLLVDRGAGMAPFVRDQAWLQDEIRRVVGPDKVQTLSFAGSPLQGVSRDPEFDLVPYKPPMIGTVVVLLSDLGIGRPRFSADAVPADEWLEFSASVGRAGCRVVAFVPYAQTRWPKTLADALTLIEWDRGTTASTVRWAIAHAQRGNR